MKQRGGSRPGSGRPTKVDEERVRTLAVSAIEKKHGSLDAGFLALLKTEEPVLVKFVWEHAVGKPKDNINLTNIPDIVIKHSVITIAEAKASKE